MNNSQSGVVQAEGDTNVKQVFSSHILELVRVAGKQMLERGELKKTVQFGSTPEGSSLFVSRHGDDIIDPSSVEVDGVKFYFGYFEKMS